MWAHRFMCWWWRIESFSCFRICWNALSEMWVCRCESLCWVSSPESCSVMTCVCLISSSDSLSFSSWLQATHTSVAYRLGKPIDMNVAKKDAMTCVRQVHITLIQGIVYCFDENKFVLDFRISAYLLRNSFEWEIQLCLKIESKKS